MMNIRINENDIKAINQAIKANLNQCGLTGDRRRSGWKSLPAWKKAVEKAIEGRYPEIVFEQGDSTDVALEKAEAYNKIEAKVKRWWN